MVAESRKKKLVKSYSIPGCEMVNV